MYEGECLKTTQLCSHPASNKIHGLTVVGILGWHFIWQLYLSYHVTLTSAFCCCALSISLAIRSSDRLLDTTLTFFSSSWDARDSNVWFKILNILLVFFLTKRYFLDYQVTFRKLNSNLQREINKKWIFLALKGINFLLPFVCFGQLLLAFVLKLLLSMLVHSQFSIVKNDIKWLLLLLYSWRFSRHSRLVHLLVHGHMTSNDETVSRQMPWAGNIAKTMTSNRKQFTVTHEMLTAVARDHRWPDVVAGISAHFSILLLFCFAI